MKNFCCHSLLLGSNKCGVQTTFVKTSISVPANMLAWVRAKAAEEGNPVSRIFTAAVREQMARDSKRKGGRK